jgi:hypothetical protein
MYHLRVASRTCQCTESYAPDFLHELLREVFNTLGWGAVAVPISLKLKRHVHTNIHFELVALHDK